MKPLPAWAATWIEHWPAGVAALSFEQRGLALAEPELRALGRRNGVAAAVFGPADQERDGIALENLAHRLDTLLSALPCASTEGAFVRLGSRSPKDTPAALLAGLRACDGAAAVALLCAGSVRVGFDLRVALQSGLTPWVWLRTWTPMAWHDEWRCMLRGGRLVGATQYLHSAALPAGLPHRELPQHLRRFTSALAQAMRGRPALHEVVADLWLPPEGPQRLIELNPWGPPTDPGLFRWDSRDLDGTLRWRAAEGLRHLSLTDA